MKVKQEKAYNEVLAVLDNMETKYKEKIPKDLIAFFKRNSVQYYHVKINPEIPLNEQNLNRKTLNILAILNLTYWCDSDKKKKLIKNYTDNERKYQEELQQRYNVDNLFKNNNTEKIEKSLVINDNKTIEKKDNVIQKIFRSIKRKILKLLNK